MSTPLEKLNSRMTARLCSAVSSRSFARPGKSADQRCRPGRRAHRPGRLRRGGPRDAFELAAEERRHERAKHGAVAERHGHAEGNPEVAHGQAEGQPPDPPEDAEDVAPGQRRRRGVREDADQVRSLGKGERPRGDDPAEDAADEPVRLPRPPLDLGTGGRSCRRRGRRGRAAGHRGRVGRSWRLNYIPRWWEINALDFRAAEGENTPSNPLFYKQLTEYEPPDCGFRFRSEEMPS